MRSAVDTLALAGLGGNAVRSCCDPENGGVLPSTSSGPDAGRDRPKASQCADARAFGTSMSLSEPNPYWRAAGVAFGLVAVQPSGRSVVSFQSCGEEK